MVTKEKARRPRNKAKDDIPFPIVYFGFLLGFIALNHKKLYDNLVSREGRPNSILIPRLSTAMLPLFSFFVVYPLLYVWRNFVKKYVFDVWARDWAGLKPN